MIIFNHMLVLFRAQSSLKPLIAQVSTRQAEIRTFESAINSKKQELDSVTKKVEEITKQLRWKDMQYYVRATKA